MHRRTDTGYLEESQTVRIGSGTGVQQLATGPPGPGNLLTIGSKNKSWNGRMHDQSTVLVIDRSIFSIGAIHSVLPVSFRKRIAFLRRRTG
jgi:hypothetical protein